MVSDLSEYHGIDLVDALAEHTFSPRTLLSRLRCLPDDSALAAAIRKEPRGWGADRHLLATVVDALQANTWVTAIAAGPKRRPRKPTPLQRPTSTKARPARVVRVKDLVKMGG